jgi:endonuclease/exonuclease/phosphatase family metal-dependent hydrolase
MRLLTWNVQWCQGVDRRVDPARIAADARRIADPDVACFQEIAVGFEGGGNQINALLRELPGYRGFFFSAVDVPGQAANRQRFGNLILSRLPVGRVLRHSLPWPSAPDTPSMPRVAVEIVVGGLRIITTHLEYYSREHRAAQIERLQELEEEARAEHQSVTERGPFQSLPRPSSAILCGDFNLPPDDALHDEVLKAGFVDAWQALHPGKPHAHTFRVHEREAGKAPYCCDFVFVSEDLVPRLRSMRVDGETQASDHQPVTLELE